MASSKPLGSLVSFDEATKVEPLDSHTYRVHLNNAFCLGTVLNGGYISSCMLAATRAHLMPRGQPDTLTAHFEYLNRTSVGPAIVKIEDTKLGEQLSTVHVALWQGEFLSQAPWINFANSRRTVLAYATHINLRSRTGMTMPTGFEATAVASPTPNFEALKTEGGDAVWEESEVPKSTAAFQRSLQNWRFYLPRKGPFTPGVADMWFCMANGEKIKQGALAYVVDSFPYNMHTFIIAPELRELLLQGAKSQGKNSKVDEIPKEGQREQMWFPTLSMGLEIKKALPEEGVAWLAVQATSKQMKDGIYDLSILVRDQEGEMVALSHQTALVVSAERNAAKNRPKPAL